MSSATTITACANCGKGEKESVNLKSCNACHMVKYCNRECQVAHRPHHKKACKKRAAELHDEKLFKDPPSPEECPICMLPLPIESSKTAFNSCCGKSICIGCIYAMVMSEGKDLCAFCRTPPARDDTEDIKRVKNLIEKGNGEAFCTLSGWYHAGRYGMPQDQQNANELCLRGGELGCAKAYFNLGDSYRLGRGVELDKKKAKHYYELAAMGGDLTARNKLGALEGNAGNHHRAFKHFIIAARAGHEKSLEGVKHGFKVGLVTKDEYASTLRAYQQIKTEMKSDAREKAEASGAFR